MMLDIGEVQRGQRGEAMWVLNIRQTFKVGERRLGEVEGVQAGGEGGTTP